VICTSSATENPHLPGTSQPMGPEKPRKRSEHSNRLEDDRITELAKAESPIWLGSKL
jgi:hypothetical protein